MNNRTTVLLSVITIVIFVVIGIGFATSQPKEQPKPAPVAAIPLPSKIELTALLTQEAESISIALTAALPELTQLYTVEREQLYDKGQWYGAVLQYKGTDTNNRDSLRLVMKKEKGLWKLKTTPPQPLVSGLDLPDAPRAMLNDINKPATLPGTETSPAIIPDE